MREDTTTRLAQAILNAEYERLSADDTEMIKLLLLDSVGCILAGTITERGKIALELMNELGGNPHATVFGVCRTSFTQAAFVNSELLNALDYDYIGPISGHIAPFVVTPCLSLAERSRSSGKDLILALALANEVGGRMIGSLSQHKKTKNSPPWYEEHPRFTYASAIFGGVAGAAHLLQLDQEQLENALGIAGASTAVPATMKWQHMPGPAIMTKYNAWTGWISELATLSVLAAEKGFTGDRTILDGPYGYWNIVGSADFKKDILLKDLGTHWHLDDVRFKLYPTCYIYHAGIQGISNLVQQHNLKPDEITEITVYGDELMQTPNRMGTEVNTFADAQFFIRFNFALAAFRGEEPNPDWQTEAVYRDPQIRALSNKVRIEVHPEFEDYVRQAIGTGKVPILWSSIVKIQTKRGEFTTEILAPRGSKQASIKKDELINKFWDNAAHSSLGLGELEPFVEAVLDLENVDDVAEVFRTLGQSTAAELHHLSK